MNRYQWYKTRKPFEAEPLEWQASLVPDERPAIEDRWRPEDDGRWSYCQEPVGEFEIGTRAWERTVDRRRKEWLPHTLKEHFWEQWRVWDAKKEAVRDTHMPACSGWKCEREAVGIYVRPTIRCTLDGAAHLLPVCAHHREWAAQYLEGPVYTLQLTSDALEESACMCRVEPYDCPAHW